MDRPKRKLKIGDSSTYLWPRRFEFVSPFSVEECASRLEAKDRNLEIVTVRAKTPWFWRKLLVIWQLP